MSRSTYRVEVRGRLSSQSFDSATEACLWALEHVPAGEPWRWVVVDFDRVLLAESPPPR